MSILFLICDPFSFQSNNFLPNSKRISFKQIQLYNQTSRFQQERFSLFCETVSNRQIVTPTQMTTPKMTEPEQVNQGGWWEELWESGISRGTYFDAWKPLPELTRQIEEKLLPKGNRALIPGCGRGYDVELLVRSGLYEQVVGADISETAVRNANDYLTQVDPPLKDGSFSLVTGDFFHDKQLDGPFSLVYDYTFLCALNPQLRKTWAERMRNIIEKGGNLITVMFPIGKKLEDGGPPFGLAVEVYEQLLEGEGGFIKKDGARELTNDMVHEGRGDGRTWWCRWERV